MGQKEKMTIPIPIGMKFGRWTVVRQVETSERGQAMWLCRCECGTESEVRSQTLRKGGSTQCFACARSRRVSDGLLRVEFARDLAESIRLAAKLSGKTITQYCADVIASAIRREKHETA